jgi:prepilin-type N-terminal cleavage/methylation domain-containing protein
MSNRAQAGFTLIELLVSMTLLGLVFVLLFGGLRFGMRAWEHSTVAADTSDSIRTVQGLLRTELERICPRRIFPPAGQDAPARVLFSGTPRGVAFLGPVPGGGRCERLALATTADGTRRRLRAPRRQPDRRPAARRAINRVRLSRSARLAGRMGGPRRPAGPHPRARRLSKR